ncbi:MAG: lysylphosphatidylglycerol synthase transmembrane domain-containing protein [Pirellulaceae bacterium]
MKKLLIALKILISAAILWYLISKAVREDQFASLRDNDKNWGWLLAAFVVILLAHAISFIRWHYLARNLNLSLSMVDALKIGFVSQFFGLIAFGVVGSDSLRAYYVIRRSPGKKAYALASVFFDRVIGLLTMMACAGVGYWLNDWDLLKEKGPEKLVLALESACLLLLWVSGLGLGGLAIAVTLPKRWLLLAYERSLRTPWIGGLISRMVNVLLLFREKKLGIVLAIGMSIVINFIFVVAIYWIALFAAGAQPTLSQHVTIAPISMIANSAPLPLGLGGMEAVLDLQYQALSPVDTDNSGRTNMGVVVGFLFRILLLAVAALGSLLWLTMSAAEKESLQVEQTKRKG